MFIQPIIPHKCYIFLQDKQWFAVDLDIGLVVAITPCMKAILEDLEKFPGSTVAQIYGRLTDTFSEREIIKEIIKIEQYAGLGILVDRFESVKEHDINLIEGLSNRLKIFVVPDWRDKGEAERRYVLENRDAEYHLLTALAEHFDVCVAVPDDRIGEFSFDEPGIYPVPIASDKGYTPSQGIKPDYLAILSLSTNIFRTLPFYSHNKRIPVIRCLQSEPFRQPLVESVMIAYSLMAPYDAIVTDSHWWAHYLHNSFPEKHILEVILGGVDIEAFQPIDKLACRQTLARIWQREYLTTDVSFIGLATDMYSPARLNIAVEVAKLYPDCVFLAFVPGMSEEMSSPYDNLILFRDMYGFRVDTEALPVIFNALDMILFQEIPEHSHSFLLQAWACGLPVLRTSAYPSDSAWPGWFMQQDNTPSSLQMTLQLMEKADELLDNTTMIADVGCASRKFAESCTWSQAALWYTHLIKRLCLIAQQPLKQTLKHSSIRFIQRFNHLTRRPEPQVFLGNDEVDVVQGVALSLALTHTPIEVHGILSQLCSSRSEVNKILNIVYDIVWGSYDGLS